MEDLTWHRILFFALMGTMGVIAIAVSLILMNALTVYRKQLIPEVVNIIWLFSLIFLFGGIERFIFIGAALFTWNITVFVWDLLIDLILVALIWQMGKHRRMFLAIASLNAQRWAREMPVDQHE